MADVAFDHAYFVHAGGQLAGFALVSRETSHAVERHTVCAMAESFIMRGHADFAQQRRRVVLALFAAAFLPVTGILRTTREKQP